MSNTTNSLPKNTMTGFVAIPGGNLYYEAAGAGHPLLMLHADVADRRMWDTQFATFAQQYRVIRIDKRGFGQTTSASGAFSLTDDIAVLLKHLNVTRTFIMGLSNGGRLALDFTLAYPAMVAALIVVAGGISGLPPSASEAEGALFQKYTMLQEQHDAAGLLDLGVHVWCDGPGQPEGRAAPEVRDTVREMMTETSRNHPEELQPIELARPALERLAEIQVPTLVISGEYDFSGTNGAMELLAQQVPGAQHTTFATAHMVNMEQPAAFNARVLDFLAAVSAMET